MKNKLTKTKVIIAIIVGILLILALWALQLNKSSDVPTNEAFIEQADYATLNVFENKLMQPNRMITYNTSDFEILSNYFDGVRLYINVKSTVNCKDAFSIKSKECFFENSVFLSNDETSCITDNSYVIIFNSIQNADLSDLRLYYDKEEICKFGINDNFANKFISKSYFEEMQLNWIQFGKTSTIINCKIAANIQGKSFLVEQNDKIVNVYVIAYSEDEYTFLIPLEMNENSDFNFISKNEQSVELRIPINLDMADLEVHT